jgi:hypothetical protein
LEFYTEEELSSSSLKLNCKFERILLECFEIIGGEEEDDVGRGIDLIKARFCC